MWGTGTGENDQWCEWKQTDDPHGVRLTYKASPEFNLCAAHPIHKHSVHLWETSDDYCVWKWEGDNLVSAHESDCHLCVSHDGLKNKGTVWSWCGSSTTLASNQTAVV